MQNVSDPAIAGQQTDPSILRASPEAIQAGDEALDQLNALLDVEPPTSRKRRTDPPDPLSRIAVRADGALLLSLEDADGCDLSGREIVRCLVLSAEETAFARESA